MNIAEILENMMKAAISKNAIKSKMYGLKLELIQAEADEEYYYTLYEDQLLLSKEVEVDPSDDGGNDPIA
jgi:hypothetical protein